MNADASPPPAAETDAPPRSRPLRDAARLALKALSVALVCAIAIAVVVFTIPEGNDYAYATVMKHERLASIRGPKIVLVGGSNLAYGIDSALIERDTDCPVVNMGMNGFFGVRYMLEEVRPQLHEGDTVVIALEYDSFFKSVEGTASNLLLVVKENPVAFTYLTWRQQLAVLGAMPYVAQEKVVRLSRQSAFSVRDALLGPDDDAAGASDLMSDIETAAGFNSYGDLTSHLGMEWPLTRSDGIPASTPVDPQVIPLLREFQDELEAEGVRVMVSYTPLERGFYERNQAGIDNIEHLMRDAGLNVVSSPSDYVYDPSVFFDTVFHVDAVGREMRSTRLAQDINAFVGGDAECEPENPIGAEAQ